MYIILHITDHQAGQILVLDLSDDNDSHSLLKLFVVFVLQTSSVQIPNVRIRCRLTMQVKLLQSERKSQN